MSRRRRRWAGRALGTLAGGAALGRLLRAHRQADAAGGAVTAEQVALLRGVLDRSGGGDRAHLSVAASHQGRCLVLDRRPGPRSAVVSLAALPVADGRADAVRALGVLDGTVHADAVLREARRALRSGGSLEVDVANAAAADPALLRRDPVGLVSRLAAGRGRAALSRRDLVAPGPDGRPGIAVAMTHAELVGLAADMGFEATAGGGRPGPRRLLARRLRLQAVAARAPRRRPLHPWWPALLAEDLPLDYLGPRPEVAALVPGRATRALDLGCAAGSMGMLLEERGIRVTGVELDPRLARRAEAVLSTVVCADLVEVLGSGRGLDPRGYDVVVAADCLEHLAEPAEALRQAVRRLVPGGWAVVSLPNVRHWETLWQLGARGVWPQRRSGIHDRTHLRWFTRRSVVELLEGAGLEVEVVDSVRRVREARASWMDSPARLLPGVLGELVTFQWLARARRRD